MSRPGANAFRGDLCIALHDVSPSTWPECQLILALLEELGAPRMTLLVVPDFHHCGRADQSPEFRRALLRYQEQGHEIALHGYVHLDEAEAPRDIGGWWRRRVMTAGEGEFAAMGEAEAAQVIAAGCRMFAQAGWQTCGFVPPAWLANAGVLRALRRSGLEYTSDHHALIDLCDDHRITAPVLTASARNAWRRGASRIWLEAAVHATTRFDTVRVGLHPEDARHPETLQHWKSLLMRLLAQRNAVTKAQALRANRCARAKHC